MFSISTDEASFAKRGFSVADASKQAHLEHCATAFIDGYNKSLRVRGSSELSKQLATIDAPSRGFAYEGAGMGFALRDGLNFVRSTKSAPRFHHFLSGCGNDHLYMAYIGAGWAAARLPWIRNNLHAYLQQFDSMLRWLVLDGYGFHQGFFDPTRYVTRMEQAKELSGYALRAFDQGLGRCLWFVYGGNMDAVIDKIAHMCADRHDDLYSGLALAVTYAGAGTADDAVTLLQQADSHRGSIGQGAAFAAKARLKANNMIEHTDTVCGVLCRTSAANAANITDQCLVDLKPSTEEPAYEIWRRRIAASIEAL